MLRFLIRRVHGGEVSSYLARLRVGDSVEIRGPRGGFDLRTRLGATSGDGVGEGKRKGRRKVVFLAGGTGIAPALQAARRLLADPSVSEGLEMEVVWANRSREDCLGCDGGNGGRTLEKKGAVVAMLEEMRAKYGGRFRYACTVDEERSVIDARTITRATGVAGPDGSASNWWWPWPSTDGTTASRPTPFINSDACRYHSAKRLVSSADADPPADADGEECQCKDADGSRVMGGKNLLMVSGPDGFINMYVGPKVWGAGKELQGPVRGAVGELRRKYPNLAEDWLVLKT